MNGQSEQMNALNPDDFYVYIFDEIPKNNQMKLRKSSARGMRNANEPIRKLNFWCMNAASGMKEI